MRLVIGWVVTVFFTLFMLGLVDSALQLTGRLPTPACYIRIFSFEPPAGCEVRLFPRQQVLMDTPTLRIQTNGPEKLWLAQATTSPKTRFEPYDTGLVYLQYSEPDQQRHMEELADELVDLGWPIGGIEFVTSAPDQIEIRYFHGNNYVDALLLAQTIDSIFSYSDVYLRDFSKSGLRAQDGLLEIWVSSFVDFPS